MSKNYFSVVASKPNPIRVFPFDETAPTSLRDAYARAVLAVRSGERLAVWSMPSILGPWRQCDLVGHRAERAITADIRTTEAALRTVDDTTELDDVLTGLYVELTDRRQACGVLAGDEAA